MNDKYKQLHIPYTGEASAFMDSLQLPESWVRNTDQESRSLNGLFECFILTCGGYDLALLGKEEGILELGNIIPNKGPRLDTPQFNTLVDAFIVEVLIPNKVGFSTNFRTLDDHHDGHGLNESLIITSDERNPDAGNASHSYTVTVGGAAVASIHFQEGPRTEETSIPGITEEVLLTILLDRFRGFQSGPFACRENAIVLTKLEECLMWQKKRADTRAKQRVLRTSVYAGIRYPRL